MNTQFGIKDFQPLIGIPVLVTTNWNTYQAALEFIEPGFSVFKTNNPDKWVQLSVVRHWSFA